MFVAFTVLKVLKSAVLKELHSENNSCMERTLLVSNPVPSNDFNLTDGTYKVTKACIIVEMNKDDGTGTGKYVAATYKVTE